MQTVIEVGSAIFTDTELITLAGMRRTGALSFHFHTSYWYENHWALGIGGIASLLSLDYILACMCSTVRPHVLSSRELFAAIWACKRAALPMRGLCVTNEIAFGGEVFPAIAARPCSHSSVRTASLQARGPLDSR